MKNFYRNLDFAVTAFREFAIKNELFIFVETLDIRHIRIFPGSENVFYQSLLMFVCDFCRSYDLRFFVATADTPHPYIVIYQNR